MRITKAFSMLLVAIISSFFFVNEVNAYIKKESVPATNTFTIAEQKTITYEYYVRDENNQDIQVESTVINNAFDGTTININDTLTTYDCNSIDHYINGQLYNGNTYTINGNTTVKEVCELNTYTITYNLNNGTLNNPPTVYSSFTPTFDLPTPTRNNYIFDGWCNGNTNCNKPSKPYTITQGSTGNITVRAQWHQRTSYRVTYDGDTRTYSHTPTGNNVTTPEGQDFTTTIRLNNDYSLESITITMGNQTLTAGTGYTYIESNGSYTITIPNVSGAININIQTTTGGGGCLVAGTDIMLWDGSTKKVEDITYNDLLKVWNHETGTYGYEYPAWLENAGTIDHYTKVSFSDGTELNIAIDHRLYSKRLNRYVNINSGELVVGDEVVSLVNGVNYVTITNIEEINEEVEYYDIISTRYFNVIANGLLTTYEIKNEISSNYKGFTSEMTWAESTPEDRLMSYEELITTFGYVDKYLYKTLKLADFKYAVEEGFLTQDELIEIIEKFMMNDDYRHLPPRNGEGQYLWMVTTSDDINPSSPLHQMVEGEIYTVPTPNNEENFLYWYNHSDNKYYQPGDQIEVDSSMYLEAIYN